MLFLEAYTSVGTSLPLIADFALDTIAFRLMLSNQVLITVPIVFFLIVVMRPFTFYSIVLF